MNYYERHIGDYAKDAGHLSMLEHGAYTLLLDRYYATEQPIPVDQVYRIGRAKTREEKAAVDAVLAEFFVLNDGAWRNGRTEEEIEKTSRKIGAARTNGAKGGRPKKNQSATNEKPTGFSLGSENETQQKAHQTPDTRHQTPDINTDIAHAVSEPRAGAVEPPNAPDGAARAGPTMAAAVCTALRASGVASVNPGNPKLLALLAAGAGVDAFVEAGRTALAKPGVSNPFAYLLAAVEGQLQEAKAATETGHAPQRQRAAAETFRERDRRLAAEQVAALAPQVAAKAPTTGNGEIIDAEVRNVAAIASR